MTEIELHKLLEELLAGGESEFVEFKKNDYSAEEAGKYCSALSNGACLKNQDFGFLVFGIDNTSLEIVGTKKNFENKKSHDDLNLHLRNFVSPQVKFEIYHFSKNEKPIVLFKFEAARGQPTTYKKSPWGRVGPHNVNLNEPRYSDLLRKICNSTTDWSAQIIESATIEDLDEAAIIKAKEKFGERRENARYLDQLNKWDSKTFLNKSEILINGKISNAALILLGKRESRHNLRNVNVAEITWGLETAEEKSYEHFYPPFLLCVSEIWNRIRNTKYKLFPTNELLAREVNKYDETVILEAIYNCIAHQDYFLNSRILLTEKADRLIFTNAGNFFEGKAEDYATGEKIAQKYRNPFLVNAMVNLGMIDKRGYGINKMFLGQKRRFFPFPDYSKSDSENVNLEIYGRVINENFSQLLMEQNLDFPTTILLDRVQKNLFLPDKDIKILKKKKLIEGRKGQYFIAAEVAAKVDKVAEYIHEKGQNNEFYQKMILDSLKIREATRDDINRLLLKKLPDSLNSGQKTHRINNLIQSLRISGKIKNHGSDRGSIWRIAE